jgi:uncharacterized protein (TIGR02246 family)
LSHLAFPALFTFVAAFLLVPLAWVSDGSGQSSTVSEATVREAIAHTYERYVAAAKRHDALALAALYDDSAMLIPPGRDPIVGREGIIKEYRAFASSPGNLVDETFTSIALTTSASYAVDVSTFAGHWNVPGKGPRPFRGKNMVVWKRERGGSWKIYRDMWDEYHGG